MITSSLAI